MVLGQKIETDEGIMNADIISGLFGFFGGLFLFHNCCVLYKQKLVRGVSLFASAFFALWAIWNIYYFSQLDQPFCLLGSIISAVASTLWIVMAVYYRYHELKNLHSY